MTTSSSRFAPEDDNNQEGQMRRTLLLIALASCAGGPRYSEEVPPRQPTIFTDPSTGTLLGEHPRAVAATLASPPGVTWLAVKKVYSELEIPVTVENPGVHQIGNQNFYKTRQLGGRSMTDFVDCGNSMTGPKAATYRIYMSLLTDVIPDGKGGTKVQTTFIPMGQDMSGASADRIVCATTGRLEALFLERVKAGLGTT
jgi:hypothetical protein